MCTEGALANEGEARQISVRFDARKPSANFALASGLLFSGVRGRVRANTIAPMTLES